MLLQGSYISLSIPFVTQVPTLYHQHLGQRRAHPSRWRRHLNVQVRRLAPPCCTRAPASASLATARVPNPFGNALHLNPAPLVPPPLVPPHRLWTRPV